MVGRGGGGRGGGFRFRIWLGMENQQHSGLAKKWCDHRGMITVV